MTNSSIPSHDDHLTDKHKEGSTWDPEIVQSTYRQLEGWNSNASSSEARRPPRVQDLVIPTNMVDSDHEAKPGEHTEEHASKERQSGTSDDWPYTDSSRSPCRLFGRKQSSSSKLDSHMFDPNFADKHKMDPVMSRDDSDIESVYEDEEDEGGLASYLPPKQVAAIVSPERKLSPRKNTITNSDHGSTEAENESTLVFEENADDTDSDRSQPRRRSSVSLRRNRRFSNSSSSDAASGRRGSNAPHSALEEAARMLNGSKDSSDTDQSVETKKRTKRRTRSTDSLSGNTFHGGTTEQIRSTRKAFSRSRSSDGMELRKRDELSRSSLHGSSSVSRVPPRRTSSRPSSRTGGRLPPERRGNVNRAMSTHNVKPPEEYGPHGGLATKQESNENILGDSSDEDPDSDDEFGAEQGPPVVVQEPRDTLQRLRKATEGGVGRTKKIPSRKASAGAESRDVLMLLREKKKIRKHDMMDKDNRRLVHFLMYEQKMGVSLKELSSAVADIGKES